MKTLLAQVAVGAVPIAVIATLAGCFAVAWLIAWTRGREIASLRQLVPPPRADGRFGWLPAVWPNCVDENKIDGEQLGQVVRAAWVAWAERQTGAKASWLLPWGELPAEQKQADREIGFDVAKYTVGALFGAVWKLRNAVRKELSEAETQVGEIPSDDVAKKTGELAGVESAVALCFYFDAKISREARKSGKLNPRARAQ